MKSSLISYIRDAKPYKSLFNPKDSNSIVSFVNTNFFVNYTKLLKALAFVKENID
jgi:hypothetical protein